MSVQESSNIQPARARTVSVKRITPTVSLPEASVLRQFSPQHAGLLRRRLSEPAECVYDARFASAAAEQLFLGALICEAIERDVRSRGALSNPLANDDSGIDLLAAPTDVKWTGEQERDAFLAFNYCRYRTMRVLREFRGKALTREAALELIRWETASRRMRGELVRNNVPLVLAMTKRTKITGVDPADMISEGNLALLRSVDKFDCSRGFKFSTYACRSILKAFSRVATRTARYRGYFPTEFDPTLEKSDFTEQRRQRVEEDCVKELRSILGQNLANLSEMEQAVIKARFPVENAPQEAAVAEDAVEVEIPKIKTLEQVGEMIGVTKERVRQIQNRALCKLRSLLESNVLQA